MLSCVSYVWKGVGHGSVVMATTFSLTGVHRKLELTAQSDAFLFSLPGLPAQQDSYAVFPFILTVPLETNFLRL